MELTIINASPRGEKGASATVVNDFISYVNDVNADISIKNMLLKDSMQQDCLAEIKHSSNIMFVFPLYFDSLPGNLVESLEYIRDNREAFGENKNVSVIVNCGLHEAVQTSLAIEMIKMWTREMEYNFVVAAGFGGGGALTGARKIPVGEGVKKYMKAFFDKIIDCLCSDFSDIKHEDSKEKCSNDNIYATIDMPRDEYIKMSELGWRKLIIRNGLEEKDLDRRIGVEDLCRG
ncbi:MAG: hypothetical protein PUI85_03725 [Eubacteriales bacterium]|nr:hypothetical protein [Eubacteriales bacterium]MDY3332269.1 hypothetical protein [Gallibacter sp.]